MRTGPAGFRFRSLTVHGEFRESQREWFEDPSHEGAEEGPLRPLALGTPKLPMKVGMSCLEVVFKPFKPYIPQYPKQARNPQICLPLFGVGGSPESQTIPT